MVPCYIGAGFPNLSEDLSSVMKAPVPGVMVPTLPCVRMFVSLHFGKHGLGNARNRSGM